MPEGRRGGTCSADVRERLAGARVLRERDATLSEEQSSLRRIATLVAGGAESEDVFAAVVAEVAGVLDLPLVEMSRFESDGSATVVGSWGRRPHPFEAGTRWPLDGPTL